MTSWADLRARVLYEDDDVLVLDKPAGISVMGERHNTDITDLAAAAGEELRWVHRIDKATSGVVAFAKHRRAHGLLTRQFADRSAHKRYLVICDGRLEGAGLIDLPLSVGRKNRVRVAAPREAIAFDPVTRTWTVPPATVHDGRVYPAQTRYDALWHDDAHTLLVAEPVSGRRHQIRVHLAWIGHAISGDPLFDRAAEKAGRRCCLHAWQLSLSLPDGGRRTFRADPEPDFWTVLGGRAPVQLT